MFLHCFKYAFLNDIRTKVTIFWVILFPMILGTLFNFAFMGIYEQKEVFSEIPAAVVNGCETGGVKEILDSMSSSGTKLISAHYVDEETAVEMLKNSEVDGIIYDDMTEPELTVRSGGGISASILKTFLDRYKTNAMIITNTAETDPSKLPAVIENMKAETTECLKLEKLSSGNMNPDTSYFYNLLAMACLFVSMVGMNASINTQANLSTLGARVTVSPASKIVQTAAGLSADLIIFYTGIAGASAFLFFILGIDFGISFGEVLIVNLFGIMFGLSLGFFVGSIGKMTFNTKLGILLAFSLGNGFLSGLMAEEMPLMIEKNCPIINRLNPSRIICDSFYAINSYGWGGRVRNNLIILTVMSALLIISGCLLTRRRKFKTL